jgi:hypothetical protein
MSYRCKRPMEISGLNHKKQGSIPTKRKGSYHPIIISSIVHHEIAKFGSEALLVDHIQHGRGKVTTVVLPVDIF